MKKFIGLFVFIGFMGLMNSCMEEVTGPEEAQKGQVAFIISDFKAAPQTKSAFQIEDSKLKFQWSADDAIGIFPESGWQTEFSMEEGAGTSVAIFDGGSWGLKNDATYYAYYPFSADNFESKDMRERVKYSYVGQEACFVDANGVVDLSGYDFMASGASSVENESVSFRFSHLGALCRLRFAAPATASYSYFVLESGSEKFSMSGCFDATDKDGNGISLIASAEAGTQFRVDFPTDHQTFAAGDNVELYFLMPPVDLTGQTLTVKFFDADNNNYDFDIAPKNIVAGMSYSWNVNVVTQLGPETANSYIVPVAGTYSFPTVKGNSSESVGEVASAEVLWETYGTDIAPGVGALVSDVKYSDGRISFKASSDKGNASIAAKDAAGKILWSWHIWMTDQPEDQVYRNNAGTMMDRNLGATSATPGDVGALGLLYQWGRKDPFMGSSDISSARPAISTNDSWQSVTSDATTGTIQYSIENPTTRININDLNRDWYYSGNESVELNRWKYKSKGLYDPCPPGYRVPDGGKSGIFNKAFGESLYYFLDETAFNQVNKGYDFSKDSMTEYYLTEEGTCWYPAAGNMSMYGLGDVGQWGSCWTTYSESFSLQYMYFYTPDMYSVSLTGGYNITGSSVRCQKIASAPAPEPVVATDLSVDGTANSYIVSEAGTYKFPAVKGNSSDSVGEVASAEVIWETFGTDVAPAVGALVSNAAYADNFITFEASDKKGNALIAAKDATGKILWSWHIWMTDQPEDQVYRNNAGTMMDRNLGATSATPGDVGALGLLYQWGRKDPFLGGYKNNYSLVSKSTLNPWPEAAKSDATIGNIEYAIANPTTFICQNDENMDWCFPGNSNNDTRWQVTKTIYDPCPAGYRVSDGGENATVWSRAFGVSENFYDEAAFDEALRGFNFVEGTMDKYYLTDEDVCWYPIAGDYDYRDGNFSAPGMHGFYWTSSIRNTVGCCFVIWPYSGGMISPLSNNSSAYGFSVRCQKDIPAVDDDEDVPSGDEQIARTADFKNIVSSASIVKFDVEMDEDVKYVFYEIYKLDEANGYMNGTEKEKAKFALMLETNAWAVRNPSVGVVYTAKNQCAMDLSEETEFAILYVTANGSGELSNLQMSDSFATKNLSATLLLQCMTLPLNSLSVVQFRARLNYHSNLIRKLWRHIISFPITRYQAE